MSGNAKLSLEATKAGSKSRVTAKLNGVIIHMDTLDLANATQRQRFVKTLGTKVPAEILDEVDSELLKLAGTLTFDKEANTAGSSELDVSSIIRPELFHTKEVSGLAVPVVMQEGGEAVPKWRWYLRWADGKRECRELASPLSTPDGQALWVNPMPAAPPMTCAAMWSRRARGDWIEGDTAPSPSGVFYDLCKLISHFVEFPPEAATGNTATLALWVMLTYGYRAWAAVPYLYVGGPMNSGKSRLFDVLAQAVFRPLSTSNVTGPALFRTLHGEGGTVLADEAERLKGQQPEVKELLSMFLAGYKRGGTATRLEPVGDGFRTVHFDVYSPKALACIAGLPPALLSRCIPVMMCRAAPGSQKPRRPIDASKAEWQKVRDDLHAFALGLGPGWLPLARRTDVVPDHIANRDRDIWQPLLALAGLVQESGAADLLDLVQAHATGMIEVARQDQMPEADEGMLESLARLAASNRAPTSGEILDAAKQTDPSPFDGWTANTVSHRLKNYGIPVPEKTGGKRQYRSVLVQLARVQERYGVDLGISKGPAEVRHQGQP